MSCDEIDSYEPQFDEQYEKRAVVDKTLEVLGLERKLRQQFCFGSSFTNLLMFIVGEVNLSYLDLLVRSMMLSSKSGAWANGPDAYY